MGIKVGVGRVQRVIMVEKNFLNDWSTAKNGSQRRQSHGKIRTSDKLSKFSGNLSVRVTVLDLLNLQSFHL